MPEWLLITLLFIGPFVVILPIAVILNNYRQGEAMKRKKALQEFASRSGYEFLPGSIDNDEGRGTPVPESVADGRLGPYQELADELAFPQSLALFRHQRGRELISYNHLQKKEKRRRLLVFEYEYEERRGRREITIAQTVCRLRKSGMGLPEFALAPESVLDKLKTAFGGQDIDFTESPGFSKLYRLTGKDETAVRSFFHSGLREFFSRNRGWSVEGAGQDLLVYRAEESVPAGDLAAFIGEAEEVLRLFERT